MQGDIIEAHHEALNNRKQTTRSRCFQVSIVPALLSIIALLCLMQLWSPNHWDPAVLKSRHAARLPSIAAFFVGQGTSSATGMLDLILANASGAVYLLVPHAQFDQELAYTSMIASGLGSGKIFLDRGSYIQRTTIVWFKRVSGKLVALMTRNPERISTSSMDAERASVDLAFGYDVHQMFKAVAEGPKGVLLDVTPLLETCPPQLQDRVPTYKLDPKRTTANLAECKAFVQNVELTAWLTFMGSRNRDVALASGDAHSFTLQVCNCVVFVWH